MGSVQDKAAAPADWTIGKKLSARYTSKNVLGKRKFPSTAYRHNSEGYRLGTGLSNDTPITVSDSSDSDTPPRKKKATETPECQKNKTSTKGRPSKKDAALVSESSPKDSMRDGNLGEPSCSGAGMPQRKPILPTNTHSSASPEVESSSSIPREQSRSSPASKEKPPEFGIASREEPSIGCSVVCHYCSSREQRSAVKTCLVCGASMCPEHLRAHLESVVFKNHPLVPAVEDVSPWRCQEHQEMNRIYCRPCGVCVCTVCTVIGSHKDHACISIREAEAELRLSLNSEMKKIQTKETAVLNRVTELAERKKHVLEVIEGTRATVMEQYLAMREALGMEEQQALRCVAQEESRVLGSIEEQLVNLNRGLRTFQSTFSSLQRLADAEGASRAQDQAFIMEYKKIAECLNGLSDPTENQESVEDVNQGRLDCLQEWTERRLDDVVISVPHRDPFRLLYGFSPTLDPDTVHSKLVLSAENRHVESSEAQQAYPEHEARFTVFPQVLGSKALCQGRYYWEVEVSLDEGRWKVGICDGQISKKGQKDNCRLGFYPNSWCLVCEKGKVEALHDKTTSPVCAAGLKKVGILLDFEDGCLSFYSVAEEGALTLLYSFQHTFLEPLYVALAVSKTQLSVCDLFARPDSE